MSNWKTKMVPVIEKAIKLTNAFKLAAPLNKEQENILQTLFIQAMTEDIKDTTEDCYLAYDEDGYLTCTFNHKAGDECLMNMKQDL